jgi:16S rRNA (adenine1518-N6/adenine1519-N6)-dimethyltransferase
LDVHAADALDIDWRKLIGDAGPVSIVANLPYGVATLLLVNWLETEPWPPWYDRMVLMFQREVAERIVAAPKSKAYGRLSVLAQWRTDAKIVMNLPPEAFTPPPKVASAIVEFRPIAMPEPACRVTTLARVTAAAFGQRRKMLRSSLKQLTAFPELLLKKADIPSERRAEDLSVSEFACLAAVFDEGEAALS